MRKHPNATLLVVAVLIVAAFAVTFLALAASNSDQDDSATVEVYYPFGLFSPGTLGALPTSASRTVLDSLGFESISMYQDYSLGLTKELGVSWVRMDFPYDGYGFNEPSGYLEKLRNSGIEVVGCVLPINSFAPADMAPFQSSMRDLILRNPQIKVWQIGNEPDLSWENPDDYPRFFFAVQQVIRETCPSCRIALAGAGARWPSADAEGWNMSLGIYDRIIGEIARQSGDDKKPFDVLDMHFYDFNNTETNMLYTMKEYRKLPQKYGLSPDIEFWVTECATHTGPLTWPPDSPDQTEEQQASELVTRFVTMLGAQVRRVAWARFYENYRYLDVEGGFFDNSGLIYNGLGQEAARGIKAGTKKLSFTAYQTLISKVNGSSLVHRIDAGKYRFHFDDDREPVYVLWHAGGVDPPLEIAGPVLVTDLEGNTTEQMGEQLQLTSTPVFVEKR
ncbi:MAG: hypothetical protein Q7K29_06365 [Thermoleophilia bacterium]|nr:hypothetical protein [Thermoleophilia bacterium]